MRKALKYQSIIDVQPLSTPCPCQNSHEHTIVAFRWCEETLNDDSFLPNIVDPKKSKRRNLKGDESDCNFCAISFFDSIDKAKGVYDGLTAALRRKPHYSHIAMGLIEENDGIMPPIKGGHINLFEYIDACLAPKFAIIDAL